MPDIVKYRALDSDLVKKKHWKQDKTTLLESTAQPKLMEDPNQLIPNSQGNLPQVVWPQATSLQDPVGVVLYCS